jgi:hypothetical protein
MQTSYFSNPAIKREKRSLVAISQGVPKWYTGARYLPLAPTWEMVKMKDMVKYTTMYIDILSKLIAEEVRAKLEGSILLCWEKPGEFCHRRLVAQWIQDKTGLYVPEFGVDNQLTLF